MGYKNGVKITKQQLLSNNSFNLHYFELEPKLSWQPGASFRWSINFRYSEKRNRSETAESAFVRNLGTELKYNLVSKGSLSAQFNFLNISFYGNKSSSLGYEMLEALQPGNNFTWQAGWQTNLGKNMQINLSYNGRKSEGARMVHYGNMQVRAFF
jgi:lipopolysaccharide assembly outer membrane protein LptD (OstA)